jgi:hypothetical protein
VVGESVVVFPIQKLDEPVIETTGFGNIVTGADGAETQEVSVSVNVKVTIPAEIPVTKPFVLIVAIPISLLVQIPPEAGSIFVFSPIQIALLPEILISGLS